MHLLFICLSVFLAMFANAESDSGYQYARNSVSHPNNNTSNSTSSSPNSKDNSTENFFDAAPKINTFFFPPRQEQAKAVQQTQIVNKYLPPAETNADKPIITKQFFMVSAAEEEPEQPIQRKKHIIIGRPQKNYRVVFIKAPTHDNSNLKITAEYAPQEEKTVIYVLTKKVNDLNIDDIVTPEPTKPSKPEIFFIKYKTPEEATAAQKEIQEQYDSLGGTSEFSDAGVIPVKSVVGSLDPVSANEGYDYRKSQSAGDATILQPASFYF